MNEFAREMMAIEWAMRPRDLERLIAQVSAVTQDKIDHVVRAITEKGELLERMHEATGNEPMNAVRRASDVSIEDMDIRDGVAHIPIFGPMMKQVPSLFNWLGIKATSTEAVREMLALAVESDLVDSIVLDVDSPGGTVGGTAALADDVAAIRGLKPISVNAPDLMASAAMWVGSQADKITVGPAATIGSIGTYSVVEDASAVYEKKGVKVHVVSSHELKGAFVEGSHITTAQLNDLQRNINSFTDVFIKAVAAGRGKGEDDIRVLATGQTWIGQEAVTLGLADFVGKSGLSKKPGFSIAANAALNKGPEMDKAHMEELERLRVENAALKDENKAAKLREEMAEVKRREDLIEANRPKISPTKLEAVTEFVMSASSYDVAASFFEDMEPVTRAIRQSVVPDVNSEELKQLRELKSKLGSKAFVGMEKVAHMVGMSEERIGKIDTHIEGVLSDGKVVLRNGKTVSREEALALIQ